MASSKKWKQLVLPALLTGTIYDMYYLTSPYPTLYSALLYFSTLLNFALFYAIYCIYLYMQFFWTWCTLFIFFKTFSSIRSIKINVLISQSHTRYFWVRHCDRSRSSCCETITIYTLSVSNWFLQIDYYSIQYSELWTIRHRLRLRVRVRIRVTSGMHRKL